jgi:hypothetical protein
MPVEAPQVAATTPTKSREKIGAMNRLVIRRRVWGAMRTSWMPPSLDWDGIELLRMVVAEPEINLKRLGRD